MRRSALLLCGLLVGTRFAVAQAEQIDPRIQDHVFVGAGGGLGCVTPSDWPVEDDPHDPSVAYVSCLHIGPLQVGSRAAAYQDWLTEAYKVIPNSDGSISTVYLFESDSETAPYLVLTTQRDTVVAVQLTGESMPDEFHLSLIRLGDPEERVVSQLGGPRMEHPIGEGIEGHLWGYTPWPLSFEIRDGRVFSMRVSRRPDR